MAALGKLFEGDCVWGVCDWLVALMRRGKRDWKDEYAVMR